MFRLGLHVFIFLIFGAAGIGLVFYSVGTAAPQEALWWQFGLLFLGSFATGAAILTLLPFALRRMLQPKSPLPVQWRRSRRQGLLLGILVVAAAGLQALRLLNPLTGLLLIAIFVLIELYIQ